MTYDLSIRLTELSYTLGHLSQLNHLAGVTAGARNYQGLLCFEINVFLTLHNVLQ